MAEEGVPPAGLELCAEDEEDEEMTGSWAAPTALPHVTNWVRTVFSVFSLQLADAPGRRLPAASSSPGYATEQRCIITRRNQRRCSGGGEAASSAR